MSQSRRRPIAPDISPLSSTSPRTPTYLQRFLVKHQCLDTLLNYLKDGSLTSTTNDDDDIVDRLYAKATACLHDLCNMLDIYSPLMDVHRERSIGMFDQAVADIESGEVSENSLCPRCKHSTNSSEGDVNFLLDDGTSIPADRQTIIQHSEYFARLLEGHYAEASQTDILLHHISKEAFLCILHHLSGCTPDSCKMTKEILEESADLAMETSARAGQFLLPGLQDIVCDILVTNHMFPSCAVDIYEHGRLHGCSKLTDRCIRYLLCCYDVGADGYRDFAQRDGVEDLYKEMRVIILKAL